MLVSSLIVLSLVSNAAGAAVPRVADRRGHLTIVDEHGRELLLRGVNVNGLIDYGEDFQEEVPLTGDDFAEMAALGLNFLRLPVSWSRIEPLPDVIDHAYVDRVAQVVGWAEAAGLHVLVDLHQDRYNRHTWPGQETDGAPDWATETDGLPCIGAQELSSACAQEAANHFWLNDPAPDGRPLQAHFLDAVLALSRRLRADRHLLGIELLNEPTPGWVMPPTFDHAQLHPFYRSMIAGLRADGERRMLWFEPDVFRDATDADPGVPAPFSRDRNLVYAPHIYTEVFSAPQQPTPIARQHLDASLTAAQAEAATYHAPLVNDEWGGRPDTGITDMLDLLDAHRIGSAYWIWKQQPGFYGWQTVQADGSLRTDSQRAQLLSRPHVDAVPGTLLATAFDGSTLTASVSGRGGQAILWGGTTVERGGKTLLDHPLTTASLDGASIPQSTECPAYVTATVALRGCRVTIAVPPGRHLIRLS